MPLNLESLLLAVKQAEARHETAFEFMQLVPALPANHPEWAPAWAKLTRYRVALEQANQAYLAGVAQQREDIRLAGAGTYEVQYIVTPPAPSEVLAA